MQRLTYSSIAMCVITATVMVVMDSCADHDMNDFSSCPTISYEAQVHEIVTTKCAISGCHNGDNGATRNWTDFSLFQAKAHSGDVKRRIETHEMPPPGSPAGPLTDEQIRLISCWADQGAKDN